MNMTSCPKCKSKLDDKSKFCGECGTEIITPALVQKETNSEEQKDTSQWQSKFVKPAIGIVSAIVLIFLFVGFTTGSVSKEQYVTGNVLNTESTAKAPVCRTVQTPYESQEEYMKTEYYTETVPYTDQECENKKLVYSITDFTIDTRACIKTQEDCNKYFLGVCTDKTVSCIDRDVTCSLKLNNLDNERGSWTMDITFSKEGSSITSGSDTVSDWLYPQSSKTLTGTIKITAKEPVDTRYTCRYTITQEPTKQVCRDVIKYKDVQKERQVTAYRPVTNYRTEQKCD